MADFGWVWDVINGLDGEAALKRALSRGGDLADLFWEHSASASFILEDGRLEKAVTGFDTGASLRVVYNDHQAVASTNELTPFKMRELAGVAAAGVEKGRPLTFESIRPGTAGPAFMAKIRPETVETKAKVDLVRRAEKEARVLDSRVKQVKVVYSDRVQKIAVLSSDGILSGDERTSLIMVVQVVVEHNGRTEVGYEPLGGAAGLELFEETSPEELARKAVSRALMLLDAEEAPSGIMPVVLSSEAGGTMIHEAIGHGLEADLAGEGLSVYSNRIGDCVASPLITVLDDATLPFRRGSFAIDDEGVPAQATVLVDKGILKGYMFDRRTAFKAGETSTGNGRRESYRGRPIVRMTNTMIAPGQDDPATILSSTPKGLLVKKMGGGQVNTVNGDFVFEISEGYLIENGRPGAPVRGATLTGNGPDILKKIDMVGSDLGFAIGTCGKDGQGVPVADAQPTLRIPEIVVGGRKV